MTSPSQWNKEKALNLKSGWPDNSNGENHYGFEALPSGFRNEIGGIYNGSNFAAYWSSDKNDFKQYYGWKLNVSNELQPTVANRNVGFSIRCIK